MQTFVRELLDYYGALPHAELTAVLLAVAYLVLAIRQNIWCWACAAISTALYVYLFAKANLYMESLLNVFYFAMAIYGWLMWRGGRTENELPVSVWPGQIHAYAIATIIFLAACSGFLLANFTENTSPDTHRKARADMKWLRKQDFCKLKTKKNGNGK